MATQVHEELRAHIRALAALPEPQLLVGVLVDFDRCTAVDATAIGVLVETARVAKGAHIAFACMSSAMLRLTERATQSMAAGNVGTFEHYQSFDFALESLEAVLLAAAGGGQVSSTADSQHEHGPAPLALASPRPPAHGETATRLGAQKCATRFGSNTPPSVSLTMSPHTSLEHLPSLPPPLTVLPVAEAATAMPERYAVLRGGLLRRLREQADPAAPMGRCDDAARDNALCDGTSPGTVRGSAADTLWKPLLDAMELVLAPPHSYVYDTWDGGEEGHLLFLCEGTLTVSFDISVPTQDERGAGTAADGRAVPPWQRVRTAKFGPGALFLGTFWEGSQSTPAAPTAADTAADTAAATAETIAAAKAEATAAATAAAKAEATAAATAAATVADTAADIAAAPLGLRVPAAACPESLASTESSSSIPPARPPRKVAVADTPSTLFRLPRSRCGALEAAHPAMMMRLYRLCMNVSSSRLQEREMHLLAATTFKSNVRPSQSLQRLLADTAPLALARRSQVDPEASREMRAEMGDDDTAAGAATIAPSTTTAVATSVATTARPLASLKDFGQQLLNQTGHATTPLSRTARASSAGSEASSSPSCGPSPKVRSPRGARRAIPKARTWDSWTRLPDQPMQELEEAARDGPSGALIGLDQV